MSAGGVNLQAQVESVLCALVKAATVELTKLFESRYRAPGLELDMGRTEDREENESLQPRDGEAKRSIGVQVEEDLYSPMELHGPPLLSDGGCLREFREEELMLVEEECLIPSEILLAEDNRQADPRGSSVKEQIKLENADMVLGKTEPVSFAECDPPNTDVALNASTGAWIVSLNKISTPTKQQPLVIKPDKSDIISGEKLKFVCPLILKTELMSDNTETSVQAEPQPACVSTAKGTAYSPSPSDGAVTPAPAKVWEYVPDLKEIKSDLNLKLKRTFPDEKLNCHCAVQLVDVLTLTESAFKLQDDSGKGPDSGHKTGSPLPKDLRRHQGLHTGHRLCCFTPCGNGVWQLQKVVTHSRDGYTCSVCKKTFKRRKILRRHERFHTGEKPYACSVCSKEFALRKSLRRHLRFHTGERPHTCTNCKKSFRLRENLKAHLRFHTGEKPFSCSTCGKMFRIMRNLEKHQCDAVFVPSFRTIAGL